MSTRTNDHGQPIGPETPFAGAQPLTPVVLAGKGIRLEPITLDHAGDLFTATCGEERDNLWTYRSDERPADVTDLGARITGWIADPEQVTFALVSVETGQALGMATLTSADTANGSIEVASILYGPRLQRSRAATEAMSLLMEHVFTVLGHRRYVWKCDSLNAASRAAAVRLGFIWEGRFRNAMVYKGRSRHTDWFSITEDEYPRVGQCLNDWLDERNFDSSGRQRVRLLARPATA